MGFIDKIKLLFKIKTPAGQIIDAVAEAKKTKKWFHFGVTLVGTLASTVACLQGVISPQLSVVLATVLQTIYNIVRGADKADNDEVKGTFRTTEFWLTALTELQKGIIATQTAGVNPDWLATSSTIIGMALAAGQNLAARAPNPGAPVPPVTTADKITPK